MAKKVVKRGTINPYSGKWNWHSSEGDDQKSFADVVLKAISELACASEHDAAGIQHIHHLQRIGGGESIAR